MENILSLIELCSSKEKLSLVIFADNMETYLEFFGFHVVNSLEEAEQQFQEEVDGQKIGVLGKIQKDDKSLYYEEPDDDGKKCFLTESFRHGSLPPLPFLSRHGTGELKPVVRFNSSLRMFGFVFDGNVFVKFMEQGYFPISFLIERDFSSLSYYEILKDDIGEKIATDDDFIDQQTIALDEFFIHDISSMIVDYIRL
jgi:hypothetical protein